MQFKTLDYAAGTPKGPAFFTAVEAVCAEIMSSDIRSIYEFTSDICVSTMSDSTFRKNVCSAAEVPEAVCSSLGLRVCICS